MNYGFVRVAAAAPELKVADCGYNCDKIIEMIFGAEREGVEIIVFPELSITSSTCADLFQQRQLQKSALSELLRIVQRTKGLNIVSITGMPLLAENKLYSCGVVIQRGKILGIVPKTYIPSYNGYGQTRWFASGEETSGYINIAGNDIPFGTDLLFEAGDLNGRSGGFSFGIEIGEDLYAPIPQSTYLACAGASVIFNLSSDSEMAGKREYRTDMVRQQARRCIAGYVLATAGVNESTTDMVFGGHTLIAEAGELLCEGERFKREGSLIVSEIDVQRIQSDRLKQNIFNQTAGVKNFRKIEFKSVNTGFDALKRVIRANPFVPSDEKARNERFNEILSIQAAGLARRLSHTGLKKAVIGISGGLDSTLALIVTAKTFDLLKMPREDIVAISMPGFGTTDDTFENAKKLIKAFNAEYREINITEACLKHFEDIGHDPSVLDTTYENVQARERTQILMDIANKEYGMVIGTGDLSELALGWCTYNGDHMSMYSVNCGIPKTLVRYLVRFAAENSMNEEASQVLKRILDTPITPELLPPDEKGQIKQKTEDIIGPYELHDFFIYHVLRYGAEPGKVVFLAKQAFGKAYSEETIKHWLKVFYKRFFSQQFKRSCQPDGPKVGSIGFSPRGDWCMPSDAAATLWLNELT